MRSREFVTELFDQPYPVKIFADQAVARDSKRRPLYVVFDRRPAWETVKVTFDRGQDFALTDWRDEHRIMATVVSAIQQWAAKYQPGSMYFSVPQDEPTNRARLYDRMVAALVQGSGYSLMSDSDRVDDEDISYYMARIGKRFGDDRFWWLVRDDLITASDKDQDLEEGWRDIVGGAALGAAVAAGGAGVLDKIRQPAAEPASAVQQQTPAAAATPRQSVTGSPHESRLARVATAAGIQGLELAQFLAQTAHETGDFAHMIEQGGRRHFAKYEPKFVKDSNTGKTLNVNPRARMLGNVRPGDGELYKGRGYIQLTGRYNYQQAGTALGLPLEQQPELLERPDIAAKVAVWYWQNRVAPRVSDFADTRAATKPINPGLRGLKDRHEKFNQYKTTVI